MLRFFAVNDMEEGYPLWSELIVAGFFALQSCAFGIYTFEMALASDPIWPLMVVAGFWFVGALCIFLLYRWSRARGEVATLQAYVALYVYLITLGFTTSLFPNIIQYWAYTVAKSGLTVIPTADDDDDSLPQAVPPTILEWLVAPTIIVPTALVLYFRSRLTGKLGCGCFKRKLVARVDAPPSMEGGGSMELIGAGLSKEVDPTPLLS
jgi:hypothetical protein